MNEQEFNQQYVIYYGNGNIGTAFKVYQNAIANHNNFCLLGKLDVLNNIAGEEDPLSVALFLDESNYATFYATQSNQPGNVLREPNWSIGVNDSWVIGGINGRSTFNFTGVANIPLLDFNEIYLKGQIHPITITAREILGLIAAGYIPSLRDDTLFFSPPADNQITATFDFVTYQNFINHDNPDYLLSIICTYLEHILPNN